MRTDMWALSVLSPFKRFPPRGAVERSLKKWDDTGELCNALRGTHEDEEGACLRDAGIYGYRPHGGPGQREFAGQYLTRCRYHVKFHP